ncbi:MAG: BtrH N-terminal domain-containing protein [Erysipelotrichaceae bacterium]|nr:BtrH N-terminal domain-containing protein [Erysipelotrichaceae bacterium]
MELNIPIIYDQDKVVGYGGNQDWFDDIWAQRAGCASVLGSDLYGYYHHHNHYELKEFLPIMEEMFSLMKPGNMGYPYLKKFGNTFSKRMKDDHISLKPIYLKKSKNYKHAMTFVKESIDEGYPVGMLILHHRAKELVDDNWHWICLTGYTKINNEYHIIFSDCGVRRVIETHILFDTCPSNVFKMVRMKDDPTK